LSFPFITALSAGESCSCYLNSAVDMVLSSNSEHVVFNEICVPTA